MFGLLSSCRGCCLNGKQALYGIGGSSALRNGEGNGGGIFGYSLCRGTNTGGKTINKKTTKNYACLFPSTKKQEHKVVMSHIILNILQQPGLRKHTNRTMKKNGT